MGSGLREDDCRRWDTVIIYRPGSFSLKNEVPLSKNFFQKKAA